MLIIGCDYHPSFQQISCVDRETGEYRELWLEHKNGEAESFYRNLAGRAVRVGVEATGGLRWFERLLRELGWELWLADPARVRAAAGKSKTDKEDARLLLRWLLENRFPRIWAPTVEQRDARQLVLHRHKLVQTRTRAKNQLQALATNAGIQKRVWTQAGQGERQKAALSPWASVRRQDWLELLADLNQRIVPLDGALAEQAEQRAEVKLLMTHRGVGPVVATAFVVTLCDPHRFASSKQVAAYVGLGAARKLQRQGPATAGAHHQAREQFVAGIAGRSGSYRCALGTGMAAEVYAAGHEKEPLHGRGGDRALPDGAVVVDVEVGTHR